MTDMLARAVRDGIDNEFIKGADTFGRDIARAVTTSQIRNIYGSVKKLEMQSQLDLAQLLILKPRIAYARSRQKSLDVLATVLSRGIDAVNEGRDDSERQERFRRFCQGFEAILAYHRAHGGK